MIPESLMLAVLSFEEFCGVCTQKEGCVCRPALRRIRKSVEEGNRSQALLEGAQLHGEIMYCTPPCPYIEAEHRLLTELSMMVSLPWTDGVGRK